MINLLRWSMIITINKKILINLSDNIWELFLIFEKNIT